MERREIHLLVLIAGLILQAIAVWRHEHRPSPDSPPLLRLVARPW